MKAQLNKFLKKELLEICKENNITLPSSVKTKKDLIDFMIKYESWPKPLNEIIEEKKPKSSSKGGRKREPSGVSKAALEELSQTIIELKKRIESLEQSSQAMTKDLSQVKSTLSSLQETEEPQEDSRSIEPLLGELFQLETSVLEAIPEGETEFLDDILEFVEDIEPSLFLLLVKRFIFYGIVEGEEGEGNHIIELEDGRKIAKVKRVEIRQVD